MRKFIIIFLSAVFIILILFPSGNYETVASINIGDGKDDFLIKHVTECGDYPVRTYITPNNEFCILFPNNRLIRKYTPDFSSYEIIPVSDSLIKRYTRRGDAEFIEGFMVGEDNDVWYYFCSREVKHGSVVAHQYIDMSYRIFPIFDAWLCLPHFIEHNSHQYLFDTWHYNKEYYSTSVCLNDLNKSDNFLDLVNMRTDSIWLGINTPILKNDIKIKQYGNTLILSGQRNDTLHLNYEGPIQDDSDYFISTMPQLDREGNIICLIRKGSNIQIMKRFLM